jgi:hypothetical protein
VISAKVNTSNLTRKIAAATAVAPALAEDAARAQAGEVVKKMLELSRGWRDTGRYYRAWQQAGNDVGAGLTLIGLDPGKRAGEIRVRLLKQARYYAAKRRFWQEVVRARVAKGAKGRWLNEALNKLERATDQEDKALEQIRLWREAGKDGAAVLVGGRATKNEFNLSNLATIRTKVYGGDATTQRAGDAAFVTARNREPHARLVEYGAKRSIPGPDGKAMNVNIPARRPMTTALAVAKGQGIKPVSRAALAKKLKDATQ